MKLRKTIFGGVIAGALAMAMVGSGSAAVTFDPATGTGFVGKGDVQLALGLNNKQIQDPTLLSSLVFTYSSLDLTEVSWECTNTKNENVQERERTTETSISGIATSVARVKNQVTGFNLNGYSGTPTQSSSTDGPALNSCPTNWVLTPAGAPVLISSSGGLYVNGIAL